jgi:hypothetical protein
MSIVKPKMEITPEVIRKALTYFPDSGIFIWNIRDDVPKWVNSQRAGKKAGTTDASGYCFIRLNGIFLMASTAACLWMTGKWPKFEMDHKNRINNDDRWENLREATSSQNNANKGKRADNTSGYTGVGRYKDRWVAAIRQNRINIYIGIYDTAEEAAVAYRKKKIELFGEFGS